MIRRYAKYQWKQWLPLFAVFSVFMGLIFCLSAAVAGTSTVVYSSSVTPTPAHGSSLLSFIIVPAFLCTAAMAMFVFSYRTSKRAADTFYQVPEDKKAIKRTRILLGLIILLSSFTIAFLLGVLIYFVRYITTPEAFEVTTYGETTYTGLRNIVNFQWYPLAYLVIAIFITGEYFLNLFLVSHGDYIFDQICLLFFGNLILGLIVIAPFFYVEAAIQVFSHGRYPYGIEAFLYGLSGATPIMFLENAGQYLIGGAANQTIFTTLMHTGISSVLYLLAAGGAGTYCLLSSDPSGEYAGLHGARNKWVALIPHAAALLIGVVYAAVNFLSYYGSSLGIMYLLIIGTVFAYLMIGTVYYIALSLWRLNFCLTKWDLKWLLIVMGIILVLVIFALVSGVACNVTNIRVY